MTQKWQPIDEVHESVFNKHMRAIFNFMEEGTVILDRYKRIILINKSAQDFIGYTYDEIYQYPFEHLIDNKKHLNQIWEVVHSARKWQGEVTVRTKKNLFVSYRLVLREIRNEQGDLINYYALLKDMTEYEQSRSKLRLAAKVIENTSEGVMVTNKDGEIMSVNPAFTKVTGYSQEEAIGNNPSFLQSGVHSKPFYEKMWKEIMETGSWNGEIWNRRKDGSLYPEWVNISAIYTNRDDVSNYVAVFSDITERKKAEERLKQLAHYDVLTGVANRYFFNTQLDKFIEQAKYNSNALAVLFLDLDRFKVINDTLGHDIGDELLKGVANRMKKCLPKEAFIARLGGDEFTVLLPKVEDRTEASKSATCIIDAFKKPFNFEGHEVYVTTSIGISLFPQDGEDGEQLVKHSDMAMYEAKSRARNTYTYYREDLDSSKLEMVELENHL
ncbi:diguanylate cyclase domain-containing protein [Bacillus solimangrovi]|uniref:diguanylate cyclase domain-containing protein n=1 Tax=Bacillus solimangrovi TaxID=1305675 RepID=UPI000AFE4075|nr:diguanylate cyclase [Bacillus solimangrovi]